MAAPTITCDPPRAQRVSRELSVVVGTMAFGAYESNGVDISTLTRMFRDCKGISFDPDTGYQLSYDRTNRKVIVYYPSGTPAVVAEAAHTHAVALDGGATGAEATHTHAVALDSGASAAGSSHSHGMTTATSGAEAAHTHAIALDSGASAAGASHNHAFTGTAEAPLVVVEGVVAVAANVGTLAYLPFYIMAVEVTAGATTGAFNVIPVGKTPLSTQVAVNFTTGGLTFLAGDAVTAARVTYLPQQLAGPHVVANLVIDESVTASASATALANQACMVQYVWDNTDGILDALEPVGEQPSATHIAVVDIDAGTSDTKVDSHADDAGNTLKVTYVKFSAYPVHCCRGDTDLTLASEVYGWVVNHYRALAIPGLGTQVVGEETGTGNEVASWEGPSGTAANAVAVWDPRTMTVTTNNTNAFVTLSMPWVYLDPTQFPSTTPAGTNAAEATHTHASGTLADAASGVGASHTHSLSGSSTDAEAAHTHACGTLADAASGAGASHTHAYGNLTDAASAAGASHTHTTTAEVANEVANAASLAALTAVKFLAWGCV